MLHTWNDRRTGSLWVDGWMNIGFNDYRTHSQRPVLYRLLGGSIQNAKTVLFHIDETILTNDCIF